LLYNIFLENETHTIHIVTLQTVKHSLECKPPTEHLRQTLSGPVADFSWRDFYIEAVIIW